MMAHPNGKEAMTRIIAPQKTGIKQSNNATKRKTLNARLTFVVSFATVGFLHSADVGNSPDVTYL
jgi:hypothetical protein